MRGSLPISVNMALKVGWGHDCRRASFGSGPGERSFCSPDLLHKEQGGRVTLRIAVENLTNKVTLYNFLSTFSGTHFVPPRTYQVSIGYAF